MEGVGILKPQFWQGKSVLITGHTGFKGSWLSLWLHHLGARVSGYATQPPTDPSLFELASVASSMKSIIGDVRDIACLNTAMQSTQPEILFHMAAQPLVRPSYENPVETFSTNIMGTVNVLEAVRRTDTVRAVVIVTSDKCYENREWLWGYRENEAMGGHDPYSCSKACVELVTASYRHSFFSPTDTESHYPCIASARAGNVIGGGDWAVDRLVPDIVRALLENRAAIIRNPLAIRPWQHVLEPLCGYLTLTEFLCEARHRAAEAWNFGPNEENVRSVDDVCDGIIRRWGGGSRWEKDLSANSHEAHLLKLDSSKARSKLSWKTMLSFEETLDWVVEWYKGYKAGRQVRDLTMQDIQHYQSRLKSQDHG
jgi:CDP-glucose 4,6-dehydratase